MNHQISPYGSWKSPITSDLISKSIIKFGHLAINKNNIYWVETRPNEKGRNVLVSKSPDNIFHDLTPSPFNVRTRVHEYGGADFLVVDKVIYFSNFKDQALYKLQQNSIKKISFNLNSRYADGIFDKHRNHLIYVREEHVKNKKEPINSIISINLKNNLHEKVIISGNDFYSSPKLSPNNHQLSWISWNHPNMLWDNTEFWVANLDSDGSLVDKTLNSGGKNESVLQPTWSPQGKLYFISDKNGWWNIYSLNKDGSIECIYSMKADFDRPQWTFGNTNIVFESENQIICSFTKNGIWYIAKIDLNKNTLSTFPLPYSSIRNLCIEDHNLFFIGSSPIIPASIIKFNLNTLKTTIIKTSSQLKIDKNYISIPKHIKFKTGNGFTAYGLFYHPKNKNYNGPKNHKYPLIIQTHGGPTASTSTAFDLKLQYWTSRGFSVFDINYRGSSGHGRKYRQSLYGFWGLYDVEDCINGVKTLIKDNKVDETQVIIRGSSAGGYTTLASLTSNNIFNAAASYYGISDLSSLRKNTHKFESYYLDNLIGDYENSKKIYDVRSPINSINNISCPTILFQGLDDTVVPPDQSYLIFDALRKRGVPTTYISFENEQHGFRQSENIKYALDSELQFYSKILNIKLPHPPLCSFTIHNL